MKGRFLVKLIVVATLLLLAIPGIISANTEQIAEQISSIRCFAEPVAASHDQTIVSDGELVVLLEKYKSDPSSHALGDLMNWAANHPDSAWTPSLLYNVGIAYYRSGFFTQALEAWQMGWTSGRDNESHRGHVIADGCFGELVRMYARIGRVQELDALYADLGSRVLTGPGAIVAEHAQNGLVSMKDRPGLSFKCGPMALASLRRALGIEDWLHQTLIDALSPPEGFSLFEVMQMATELDMRYVAVRRTPSDGDYPVPSVIHWKLGHYAALVAKGDGLYLVQDPTFGTELWVTREALDIEASGYFLVSEASIPDTCTSVPKEVASQIYGRGRPEDYEKHATGPCDETADSCPTCPCGKQAFAQRKGMPSYQLHSMLASLRLVDTPVGYEPPQGPPVYLNIVYNQREANQPVTYTYSNFGHKWNFAWCSSLIEETTGVLLLTPGGGAEEHTNWNSSLNRYDSNSFGAAKLYKVSDSPIRYERVHSDGWKEVYSHVENPLPTPRRIFMTAMVDPQGKQITFNYDTSNRITTVVDAGGKTTTLCYDPGCGTSSDNKVYKVTDPYGRTATMTYDSSDRLKTITDALSLTTEFTYTTGTDFITQMATPYGVYTFEREPSSSHPQARWIEVTDPFGDKERVQYMNNTGLPYSLESEELPGSGTVTSWNTYMDSRMSFYWDKQAMQYTADCNIMQAKWTHFLHNAAGQTGRVPEYTKEPLEGRVYYNYPNQPNAGFEGSLNQPSKVARRLDNGNTQFTQMDYNDRGNMTMTTDTLGRVTLIEYDSTGVDVEKVKYRTGSGDVTVVEVEYNAHHQPILYKDASGQETTFDYNLHQKLESVTNAKNETTSMDYSTTGLLLRVTSTDSAQFTEFSYDAYDRVTSVTMFPENYTIRFEFDVWDRPIKAIYPDGTYEEQVWDKLDVAATRDRLGRWTQMRYSLLRQLVSITNPAGETIQLNWCACGSLNRLIDAKGQITAWYRDLQGRVFKKELPDLSLELYEYEANTSRLKHRVDAKNQITNYTYNDDDTLYQVSVSNVAAGTASVATVSYYWDSFIRRLEGWTDGIGDNFISYVPYNPSDSVYGDGRIYALNGPWDTDTIDYEYDQLGRLIQKRIGDSTNQVNMQYDGLGRLSQVVNNLGTFTYDYMPHTDRVTTITSDEGHVNAFSYHEIFNEMRLDSITNLDTTGGLLSKFTYGFDAVGRITEWGQDQGELKTYTMQYDAGDRLTQVVMEKATGGGKQWNWRFDKSGNRRNEQIETFTGSNGITQRAAYTVNVLDQVTATALGGPMHVSGVASEQAKITPVTGTASNVQSKADGSFGLWIDNDGLLMLEDYSSNTTWTQVNFDGEPAKTRQNITYDSNGNMTGLVVVSADGLTSKAVTYEWDALNRLVAVVIVPTAAPTTGTRSEFTYDGLGRRVIIKEKDATGAVTQERYFIWTGLTLAEEREEPDGAPVKRFFSQGEVHGTGTRFFVTRDHLGSVREVTNENGLVVAQYEFDPFGQVTQIGGDENQKFDFLYTGHFYHRPSGLNLAPYRDYDAGIGKWLSRDPIGFAGGINTYGYAAFDPINYYDSDGLVPAGALGCGVIAGASIAVGLILSYNVQKCLAQRPNPRRDFGKTPPGPDCIDIAKVMCAAYGAANNAGCLLDAWQRCVNKGGNPTGKRPLPQGTGTDRGPGGREKWVRDNTLLDNPERLFEQPDLGQLPDYEPRNDPREKPVYH